MGDADLQVQLLLDGGKLNMARRPAADRADDDTALLALVDQVLKSADRRILFDANLPADNAPAVDRCEITGLEFRTADEFIDGGAGSGFGHHLVAVRLCGRELGPRHASAGAEDIIQCRLYPGFLEIRLDDPPRGVERTARRLIDDPIHIVRREFLLR